jgi:hypothetical protein
MNNTGCRVLGTERDISVPNKTQIHDAPADCCHVHDARSTRLLQQKPSDFAAEFSHRVSHHTIHPPSLSLLLLLLLLWVPLWERIRVNQG